LLGKDIKRHTHKILFSFHPSQKKIMFIQKTQS